RARSFRHHRSARDDLGLRAPSQSLRRTEQTVGAREGSRARSGPRPGALRARRWLAPFGRRLVSVPARDRGLDPGCARPVDRRRLGACCVRPDRRGLRDRGGAAAVPAHRCASRGVKSGRSVIDTHAHLDALEDADGALARAHEAGVSRVITIGTGLASCRAALALATANAGVYAALGIDPHQAGSDEEHRVRELRELLGNERAVAVGETGLDYHYGSETKDEQRRLFEAQLRLARELTLPVVIHTREANADTESMLRAHEGTVVMHCFSEPGLLEVGLERGWYF